MKLRMHENSLFALLLRSPWWVSVLVALGLFAAVRLAVPALYAAFAALPFAVIAFVAAWRQWRAPREAPKARAPARNAPCPCGSGRKYKRCCGATG